MQIRTARSRAAIALIVANAFVFGAQAAVIHDPAGAEKRCNAGSDDDCHALALAYDYGTDGLPRDVTRAYAFYKKSCDLGNSVACFHTGTAEGSLVAVRGRSCDMGKADACYDLGLLYAAGVGVSKDDARASALFRQACERGSADACSRAGKGANVSGGSNVILGNGVVISGDKSGSPLNRPDPVDLTHVSNRDLLLLCDSHYPSACARIGDIFRDGRPNLPKDPAQAKSFYQRACMDDYAPACAELCNGGDAGSCTSLGDLYKNGARAFDGSTVEKDEARAAAIFRKACDAGSGSACGELGDMVRQSDRQAALALYRKACDAGYTVECIRLGTYYAAGAGVPRDFERSRTFYQQACDGKDPMDSSLGCYAVALQYERGLGVSKDPSRAASLYQRACDGGDDPEAQTAGADACYRLGLLYEQGSGVAKDSARAAVLFKKACDAHSKDACARLAGR